MMAKCTAIREQANGKPGPVGWVLRRFWCVAAHHGVDAVLIAVGDPCSNTPALKEKQIIAHQNTTIAGALCSVSNERGWLFIPLSTDRSGPGVMCR